MKFFLILGTLLCVGAVGNSFGQQGAIITTVAGSVGAGFSGDGGAAAAALLNNPKGIAVDPTGNIFFVDSGNYRIRKITPSGTISTVGGNGQRNTGVLNPAGPALSFQLYNPTALIFDSKNSTIYFQDLGLDALASGTITPDYNVNSYLSNFTVDANGHIYGYVGFEVYSYTPGSTPTGIAGSDASGTSGNVTYSGEGGPAINANLGGIGGIATDSKGNIYITDVSNCAIREFSPGGNIVTIAGNSNTCTDHEDTIGDGGPAKTAQFFQPGAIVVDSLGNIYVQDGAHHIRQINPQGVINAFAGTDSTGVPFQEGGPALNAPIQPAFMAVDSANNLYVTSLDRIVKITPGSVCTSNCPKLPSILGVISAAANKGITPQGFASIYGTNLSVTSRGWEPADFVNGNLPTSLDGVSVTIDSMPAAVSYISPGQINVQVPTDSNFTSPVNVVVTNGAGSSQAYPVTLLPSACAFFLYDGVHIAAQHTSDYALVAPAGSPFGGRPAVPGEYLALYGTGFGPTTPNAPTGLILTTTYPVSGQFPLVMTFGGVAVVPLAPPLLIGAGLYQINVQVPQVPSGDQQVVVTLGTSDTTTPAAIPMQ